MATNHPFEAQLRGLSKTADKDGDWFKIVLWVHPDEMPNALYDVKLRSRLGVALTQIGDNERPVDIAIKQRPVEPKTEKPHQRWEDLSNCQQAGIACKDVAFQDWVRDGAIAWDDQYDPEEQTAKAVRHLCGIKSRSELDNNLEASGCWKQYYHQFRIDTGREQEPR